MISALTTTRNSSEIMVRNNQSVPSPESINSEAEALHAIDKFEALYDKVHEQELPLTSKESRRRSNGMHIYFSQSPSAHNAVSDVSMLALNSAKDQLAESIPLAEMSVDFLKSILDSQISEQKDKKVQVEEKIAALHSKFEKLAQTRLFESDEVQARFEALAKTAKVLGGLSLAIGVCLCFTHSGYALTVVTGELIGSAIGALGEGGYKEHLNALKEEAESLEKQLCDTNSALVRAEGMRGRLDHIAQKLANLKTRDSRPSTEIKIATAGESKMAKRSSWFNPVTFEKLPEQYEITANRAMRVTSPIHGSSSNAMNSFRRPSVAFDLPLGNVAEDFETTQANSSLPNHAHSLVKSKQKVDDVGQIPNHKDKKDYLLSSLAAADLGSFFSSAEISAHTSNNAPLVVDTQIASYQAVDGAQREFDDNLIDSSMKDLKAFEDILEENNIKNAQDTLHYRTVSQQLRERQNSVDSELDSQLAEFNNKRSASPFIQSPEDISQSWMPFVMPENEDDFGIEDEAVSKIRNDIEAIKNRISPSINQAEIVIKQFLKKIANEVEEFNEKWNIISNDIQVFSGEITKEYLKEKYDWVISAYTPLNAFIDKALESVFEIYILLQKSIHQEYSTYTKDKERKYIEFSTQAEIGITLLKNQKNMWESSIAYKKDALFSLVSQDERQSQEEAYDGIHKLYEDCVSNTESKTQYLTKDNGSRLIESLRQDAKKYADAVAEQYDISDLKWNRARQTTADSGYADDGEEENFRVRNIA